MKRVAFSALLLLLAACTHALPRPTVLSDVEHARTSPAALNARTYAPQAYAHAVSLEARAQKAYEAEDTASAQILGEHALAAFERATVLARLAAAEKRRGEVAERLSRAEQEIAELDAQQKRVLAETESLELRARVLRDTLPLPENAPATPDRERARLDAARALALQARLLCASARLLENARSTLPPLFSELDALDQKLAQKAGAAPLDQATRLRSRCLAELTGARRAKTLAAPASGKADALLASLASAAYTPVRDDRGVVITLRGVFSTNGNLSGDAQQALSALGRVGREHPDFPILVVLHTARGMGGEREKKQLETVAKSLRDAGAAALETALGGDAAPVLDPARAEARARNERLEIVFVAPSAS